LLFLALAAYGQQERVAIIQTLDDRDSIGISELAYLTDRLRETAVNVLPKQRYGVMTTESIVAFLGSQERAVKICREASCLAELGRKVSADYVAQGHIGRFGENLTIKTELYSSKSGVMVGSFTGNSKDISGLLATIDEKASVLFRKLPGAEKHYLVSLSTDPAGAIMLKPAKTSHNVVAIALDIAGAVLVSAGIVANANMENALDRYGRRGQSQSHYRDAWADAESSRGARNVCYVVGGLVLASGIGVHIWF